MGCWKYKERSVVLNVGKCGWGRCVFCGWGKRAGKESPEEAMAKIKKLIWEKTPKRLKIYTSGSLLDPKQYPTYFQRWLAEFLDRSCVEELQIESLPTFIKYETIQPFLNRSYKLIMALGLEVANDEALMKLGKYPAMSVKSYISSALLLRNLGVSVKTYVLVNPPVENWEELFKETMEVALRYSDEVVIINTYPHSDSPLFKMWIDGKWYPLDEERFLEVVKPYLGDPRVSIDFNNFAFKPKFPKSLREYIRGAGRDQLIHPHYEVWQDFIVRFYKPPEKKTILLFVPCSYRKPYYKSKTWRSILRVLRKVGMRRLTHLVAISSPGVIPEEFANEYPFNSYDWPEWEETEEIKELYVKVNKERIIRFLLRHKDKYKVIAYYLKPNSESARALKEACIELGIRCIECLPEDVFEKVRSEVKSSEITHPLALKALEDCLENLKVTYLRELKIG